MANIYDMVKAVTGKLDDIDDFTYEFYRLWKIVCGRYQYDVGENSKVSKYNWSFFEYLLNEHRIAGLYNHEQNGWQFVVAGADSIINAYGYPSQFYLYAPDGQTQFINEIVDLDDKNFIWCINDKRGTDYRLICARYARKLADIELTRTARLTLHKLALVIKTHKDAVENAKRFITKLDTEPALFIDEKYNLKEVLEKLDLKIDYINDKLCDEYLTIFNRFLEEIGYTYNKVSKSERLIASENEKGKDVLINNDLDGYMCRLDFVKRLKKTLRISKFEVIKPNLTIYNDATGMVVDEDDYLAQKVNDEDIIQSRGNTVIKPTKKVEDNNYDY